jgi:hypothetical protein
MSQIEKAKGRLSAKTDKEARKGKELRSFFESNIEPSLPKIHAEFWKAHVPESLTDLFEEMKTEIEQKEEIVIKKKVDYYYSLEKSSKGKRYFNSLPPLFEKQYERWIEIWNNNCLGQVPIKTCVQYGSKNYGCCFGFEIRSDFPNTIKWFMGSVFSGRCDNSESGVEDLAEQFISLLEKRAYHISGGDHSSDYWDDAQAGGP